jgi:hypothetical protein
MWGGLSTCGRFQSARRPVCRSRPGGMTTSPIEFCSISNIGKSKWRTHSACRVPTLRDASGSTDRDLACEKVRHYHRRQSAKNHQDCEHQSDNQTRPIHSPSPGPAAPECSPGPKSGRHLGVLRQESSTRTHTPLAFGYRQTPRFHTTPGLSRVAARLRIFRLPTTVRLMRGAPGSFPRWKSGEIRSRVPPLAG